MGGAYDREMPVVNGGYLAYAETFSSSDDTRICTPEREVGILRNQLAHARHVIG